jgi:hypothetical protein
MADALNRSRLAKISSGGRHLAEYPAQTHRNPPALEKDLAEARESLGAPVFPHELFAP